MVAFVDFRKAFDCVSHALLLHKLKFKFGVQGPLSHHLSWEQHVDSLCCKLNSRLSLLRRISSFLTQEGSLHYYNACVHSQLVYCSSAWGTCSQTLLLRLLRVQKHAARIILGADFSTPSVALFSKLQWIPVNEMIKCRKLQLLFSIMTNPEAPLCLKVIPSKNNL